MVFTARGRCAEGAEQFVDLWFVAGDEGPSFAGVEFCAPGFEAFGSVGGWIDADRDEAYFLRSGAEFFLDAGEGCAEWWTDRCARCEYEIDRDRLSFNEICVEVDLSSVFICVRSGSKPGAAGLFMPHASGSNGKETRQVSKVRHGSAQGGPYPRKGS